MRRAIWLALPALAATACAKVEPPASHISIVVMDDGRHCGARTPAVTIDDLDAPGAMNRLVQSIAPASEVHLLGTTTGVRDTRIGGLIFGLQRHGIRRVGFISEPPAGEGA